MNIKTLIKCLPYQANPKKYEQFVRSLDYKKLLAEDPVDVKDKGFNNKDLVETDLGKKTKYFEMHKELDEKYGLTKIATADTDFEKVLQILDWLTKNTFYNGAKHSFITDNTTDILKYAFGKSFKNAINCRWKAIAFADCLVAVGVKAYPVCMMSSEFKNCHFTCRVYITELNKWCAFDPSFGCWFADKEGNPIDILEMREMFLQDEEPVVNGYNFNGTTECFDVYVNGFLKHCISNLSTWRDNSMDRRYAKNLSNAKRFDAKLSNEHPTSENNIAKHYDILINEGNDPVHDPEPLKAYMDKWDGQAFIDKMQLSKDKTVLEIGVGTGRLAVRTAPLCNEFYGIDISPETIKGAKKNLEEYQNVNLICDDFMTYSFNNTFDVIYSSLTFMHIKDKQNAINKVCELLKNDGVFVLSTDKNQDQFIDIGTNKIEVYPDTPEEITQCINISGMDLLEHYETEFANVFVCKKQIDNNSGTMNQNEYWNSVAEEKKFTTVLDVELFSKYVSKDCKILDVGCGYGRILNELSEAGFTDLTGVDSAENMIKRGLREYPNLNLVANPDGAIPFEDDSFDAVILFGVLTCVPDNESQKVLLNDIKRVLKPGGIIYINDFLLNSGFKRWLFYKKAQKETGIYGAFKTYDGATVRHHAEAYILNLLSDFKTLDYQKFVIPTMNGNKSNSFGFIGELKK